MTRFVPIIRLLAPDVIGGLPRTPDGILLLYLGSRILHGCHIATFTTPLYRGQTMWESTVSRHRREETCSFISFLRIYPSPAVDFTLVFRLAFSSDHLLFHDLSEPTH